ncbi:FAD-binding and (Fe-S)-binding domain-containing protein [Halobacteriales archaeon Cl-PHB]
MGTRDTVGDADPAADSRAEYDYVVGAVERPDLVAGLRERVAGDVRFDEYSRQLYATDASAYEVTPVGVVFPRSTDDVAAVVSYCADREIPVLPRGGGTSLGGQTVNEAVVLDFTRYMDDVRSVDPDTQTATAQPGAILGEVNAGLAEYDLKFAPDPAWGDKSALGGAIGNNSTGAHSLQYGKTDAYVESCEVVLADGTVTEFGEVDLDTLRADGDRKGDLEERIYAAVARIVDEEGETVESAFPELKRNVSGYNLDRLVADAESGSVNLARLLAGSEGTLAVVTEATVGLEPVPETKAIALLEYDSLLEALEDVAPILEHDPAAVEVLDDVLLDLARDTEEFGALVESTLTPETGAVLLVEFYAESDSDGRQQVADLLADRIPKTTAKAVPREGAGAITEAPQRAIAASEAHEKGARERFWKLRKSGLPILLSRTTDAKHISFIEDTAVPPENLPEFVADFQEVLAAHDTFASFYAHAGPGCLHIRPLIDSKSVAGLERMESLADDVTDLVVEYEGSVSGEHGDGRARTQWNRKLYGDEVWELFRDLKTAFDPDWLLNPGTVCGDVDITEHLRFDPDYEFDLGFDPTLEWDQPNGMQGMVELCHGCGGCRGSQEVTGGVMCPTYRAADEEITSTRGRANLLRQAMSGDLPDDPTAEEFSSEVMDLCIGCKGCKRDCPSGVDVAKLKAELAHEAHQREDAGLRDRLFANVDRLSAVGSRLAPVSNWLADLPGSGLLAEKLLGVAQEREVPHFASDSFESWFADRGPAVPAEAADARVLLVPDTYTNYTNPEAARAGVRVLEAANVHVQVPDGIGPSGRAAFSKGFLDLARERVERNVGVLAPAVDDGWDVVTLEPSDAVMYQEDARDLSSEHGVASVAEHTYGLCEFLDRKGLVETGVFEAPNRPLTYHGHCHQTAAGRDHHAVAVLRQAGYAVDALDSGCCGMAGSFGYEAEHYSMSQAIGSILYDQVRNSPGDSVVAPGASCRTQLGEGPVDARPRHPAEALADALAEDARDGGTAAGAGQTP